MEKIINPFDIISRFYTPGSELWTLLTAHSACVARKALECLDNRGIEADRRFVYKAAMLHDIGIVRCDATSIFCHGTEPYLRHGVEGAAMLLSLGLDRHALVCERHTGSGLTCKEIVEQDLPLPHRDMLPLSTEEKVICYADKFYSKSRRPDDEKPVEKIIAQMYAHGKDVGDRFMQLHYTFGPVAENVNKV